MSKELDELFAHRDFLKGEGDRFHKEFLACREKADDVHSKISELMKEVNEARDKLKIAREERESWITDHNAAVSNEMKTGAEDEKLQIQWSSTYSALDHYPLVELCQVIGLVLATRKVAPARRKICEA